MTRSFTIALACILGLGVWARADVPNPDYLHIESDTEIVVARNAAGEVLLSGNIKFCADNAAGVKIDLQLVWWKPNGQVEHWEQTEAFNFEPDGCKTITYDDPQYIGEWSIVGLRDHRNAPNGRYDPVDDVRLKIKPLLENPSWLQVAPASLRLPGTANFIVNLYGIGLDLRFVLVHDNGSIEGPFDFVSNRFYTDGSGSASYNYTEDSLAGRYRFIAVRNHANCCNGPWKDLDPRPELVLLPPADTGPPTITRLSEEVMRNGYIRELTIEGTNLLGAQPRLITEGLVDRVPPAIRVMERHSKELVLEVDMTDPNVLYYYTLVVTNDFGQAHQSFRVNDQYRPRWDTMTPARPATGGINDPRRYIFEVAGYNLADVDLVADPPYVVFDKLDITDTHISGHLEVLPNVPPGPVTIFLQDSGSHCTPDRWADCAIQIDIQPAGSGAEEVNVLAGLDLDLKAPPLYLSLDGETKGFAFNTYWGTGPATAPAPNCRLGPFRLFSRRFSQAFTWCAHSDTYDLNCLANIDDGGLADVGSAVASIWLEIDWGLIYPGDAFCFPVGAPSFCLKGSIGVEIPGATRPLYASFNACLGGADRFTPQPGALDQLDYRTPNGCLRVVNQEERPIGGVKYATLQLSACCPDDIQVNLRGDAFRNTPFAHRFDTTQATVRLAPNCRLRSTSPPPNQDRILYINREGAMPDWNARVELTAGDTENTDFYWTAIYAYFPRGAVRATREQFVRVNDWREHGGTTTPNDHRAPYTAGALGGEVRFNVKSLTTPERFARNARQKIYGTNVGIGRIHNWINGILTDPTERSIVKKIACLESGPRDGPKQFLGDRENGQGRPVFGPPNGYGIMQVDPPQLYYDLWNWDLNVSEGISIWAMKLAESAKAHTDALRRWNATRPRQRQCPAGSVPPLSTTQGDDGIPQLWRDAIRRYNCGKEYRWVPDRFPACTGHWEHINTRTDPGYHSDCRQWLKVWNYSSRVWNTNESCN